jgi:hypothetical protein
MSQTQIGSSGNLDKTREGGKRISIPLLVIEKIKHETSAFPSCKAGQWPNDTLQRDERGGRRMLFPEPETRFRKKYLPVSQSWPSGKYRNERTSVTVVKPRV